MELGIEEEGVVGLIPDHRIPEYEVVLRRDNDSGERGVQRVEPGVEDWAIKLLNQVAKSKLLTKHFLLNDDIFYPARRLVSGIRALRRCAPQGATR